MFTSLPPALSSASMFQPQLLKKADIRKQSVIVASGFVAKILLGQGLLYYPEHPIKSSTEKNIVRI